MKKDFRTKAKPPLDPEKIKPVLKTVSLHIDGKGNITRGREKVENAFRRLAEISRLKALLPEVKTPAKVGKHHLTKAEKICYELAVAVSNKTADTAQHQAYGKAIVDATKTADARFFDIVAHAMRSVNNSRDESFSATKMHTILVLVAKLELEQEKGELPDTFEVTKRAWGIGSIWFEDYSDQLAAPEEKDRWSKARKAAGLDYLPPAKRGQRRTIRR